VRGCERCEGAKGAKVQGACEHTHLSFEWQHAPRITRRHGRRCAPTRRHDPSDTVGAIKRATDTDASTLWNTATRRGNEPVARERAGARPCAGLLSGSSSIQTTKCNAVVVSVGAADQPCARSARRTSSRQTTHWEQASDQVRAGRGHGAARRAVCNLLLARNFLARLGSFADPNVWQVYQRVRVSLRRASRKAPRRSW
jgi:hypothetical protein